MIALPDTSIGHSAPGTILALPDRDDRREDGDRPPGGVVAADTVADGFLHEPYELPHPHASPGRADQHGGSPGALLRPETMVEDMMCRRSQFCSKSKPNGKPNLEFPV